MNEIEIAWLAGLLEGEGCFYSQGRSNGCGLILGMTDKDVVEKAANLVGGKVRTKSEKRPNHKPAWAFHLTGDTAVSVMKQVLPYMGQRRSQKIKEVLEKAANRRTPSEQWHEKVRSGKLNLSEMGKRSGEARRQRRRNHGTLEMFT